MIALSLAMLLASPAESASEIMAKVAENQERSQAARTSYVYKQDVLVRMLRTNNKLSREERREYNVAPTATGFSKKLVNCTGKYERGGKFYDYTEPGFTYKDADIDGALVDDLTDDLMNDKESKDGITQDLFPLTKDKQDEYTFKLEDTKDVKGRRVHRISFRPKEKDEIGWAGEVLVDAAEYQPINVYTKLSKGLPWGVKVFLGTNLQQVGFNLGYARIAEDVWFPVTYGSEFRVDVLFGYKRVITMALTNADFKRTSVDSKIDFEAKADQP